jgi:uncharacterized protein with FMN-binding domain
MDTNHSDKNKQIIATLAVLVVVVLIVIGTKVYNSGSEDIVADTTSAQTGSTNTSSDNSSSESSTGSNSSTTYKDGTYNATGTYTSPGGSQAIEVSVTVSNGTVTATSATEKASDNESQEFQEDFISGYKSLVVGKSLSSISLSRVSGSSLTSQGFNNAIEQIKEQAKA